MYILRESKTTSRHSSLYDQDPGVAPSQSQVDGYLRAGAVSRMLRLGRGGVCHGVAARPARSQVGSHRSPHRYRSRAIDCYLTSTAGVLSRASVPSSSQRGGAPRPLRVGRHTVHSSFQISATSDARSILEPAECRLISGPNPITGAFKDPEHVCVPDKPIPNDKYCNARLEQMAVRGEKLHGIHSLVRLLRGRRVAFIGDSISGQVVNALECALGVTLPLES